MTRRRLCPKCGGRTIIEQRTSHTAYECWDRDCGNVELVRPDGTPYTPRPVLSAAVNKWQPMATPSGGHRAL